MKDLLGITIKPTIGIGDKIQFTSLPENYFRATGKKLVDVSRSWVFDYNPYVHRDVSVDLKNITELWNHTPTIRPETRDQVYLSNAEHHAAFFKVPVFINRPTLYCFEDFPFEKRTKILFQTQGISHGRLSDEIVEHVLKKYEPTNQLFHIGARDERIKLPHLETPTLWDLVQEISQARMVIGPDSGPLWIAACYPDIIVKKVRTKPSPEYFRTWVPLTRGNIHSYWDDRVFQTFNITESDIGFTWGFNRL